MTCHLKLLAGECFLFSHTLARKEQNSYSLNVLKGSPVVHKHFNFGHILFPLNGVARRGVKWIGSEKQGNASYWGDWEERRRGLWAQSGIQTGTEGVSEEDGGRGKVSKLIMHLPNWHLEQPLLWCLLPPPSRPPKQNHLSPLPPRCSYCPCGTITLYFRHLSTHLSSRLQTSGIH